MLDLDITQDDELASVCNQFISTMLPHEKFNSKLFISNLELFFRYIHLEEIHMEYYVILDHLRQLSQLAVMAMRGPEAYVPTLTRERLAERVETIIPDIIYSKSTDIKPWLEREGLPTNLNVEMIKEQAQQKLYNRVMSLYDECFNLQIPSEEAVSLVPLLKTVFTLHISERSINNQARILRSELRIGNKVYQGSAGWLEYTQSTTSELELRLSDETDDNVLCIDSVAKGLQLLHDSAQQCTPIAPYGIPPVDAETPMRTHILSILVGPENVGKTMFMIGNVVVPLLVADKIVVVMCGETTKGITVSNIIVSYIYAKYGIQVRPIDLAEPEKCPPNVQKIIGMAMHTLFTAGHLILTDAFTYGKVYSELADLYAKYHFDAVAIDHSCALRGSVTPKAGNEALRANVTSLSKDVKEFRRDFPVYISVLSHPSSDANKAIAGGKELNSFATKGSQDLSADADDIYVFRSSNELYKQGLVAFENKKRRFAPRIVDTMFLRTHFNVACMEYREEDQANKYSASVDAMNAIKRVEELYDDAENEYTLS